MKQYKYKFSVVIPIYNAEKYLDEAIKSITNQTIGFKNNIQLILVNDGSTDRSEEICKRYQRKYPNNIIYISKENEGVSKTRNVGMKYIEGKYANFFDSDDIWDLGVYEKAYNMLEKNEDIDVVAVRLKYFEASNRYHWLDYKFDSDRIINVMDEPQNIVIHMSPSIIRTSAIGDLRYDEKLKISEDTKLLYQIVLKQQKYGIISSSNYNYRKRYEKNSAIQTSRENKSWYTDSFKYCHDFLIDYSMKKYGKLIKYVQHFIMYEIQWRLKAKLSTELTDKEKLQYISKIKDYIMLMDDDIIIFQKNISLNYKMLIFKIKYGDKLKDYIDIRDDGVYLKEQLFFQYNAIKNIIEISKIENNMLLIEGNIFLNDNQFEFYYSTKDGERIKIPTYHRKNKYNIFGDGYYIEGNGYKVEIDLQNVSNLKFEIKMNDKFYVVINRCIHFSAINNFKAGYYYKDKFLITKDKEKKNIKIQYKPFIGKVFLKELYYLIYLFVKRNKTKVVLQRILYWITKPFMHKNIWLFADREFMAKDSAEVLFRYINQQENSNGRKTYFVVNKNSEDYNRLKQYGNVVGYHTLKYKLLFFNAKYLISSHADAYVNNEFGKSRKFYIDLYRFKYIYLTHGVLLHDSSNWLNRINKNIELNVVTSPMEYDSILEGKYYFEPKNLIKTGLPRHDNLFNDDVKVENKVLLMPSWRSKLAGELIKGTQRRKYNPEFVNSEYYQFYNRLFNDKQLLEILKKYNYKIKFCIHPSFRAQKEDFVGNEYVEIAIDADSQYETLSSKFVVTDYSSAACDFAYLRKPVIYANFDADHIDDIHYYQKGYFDYDKYGFGPNCKNYEETVRQIIKAIENDCKMEEKYIERCDKFFYYKDNHNAQRVYEAIIRHESKANQKN